MVMEGLIYIKDKAIEENIPIFVIGDVNELNEVKAVLPEQFIKKEFMRPINVKDIMEITDKFIKQEAGHLKKKILVVDDSGAMLRNVKEWLQDKYQVIVANSGAMAIKYLAMNRPDLILLDYEMPVCDGKQVLEMIRAESEFSNVPVFFLTGKNDRESVLSVSALKPEGYLLKSMPPAQIVQTIDDFFEKRKAGF
ncbi:MAG: response regulator [Lachnospiraceae bacterium]|nr:response regulator [Lachnospiraceae bacterium]